MSDTSRAASLERCLHTLGCAALSHALMAAAVFERDERLGLRPKTDLFATSEGSLFFLLPFKSRESCGGCPREVSLLTVEEFLGFFFFLKKKTT